MIPLRPLALGCLLSLCAVPPGPAHGAGRFWPVGDRGVTLDEAVSGVRRRGRVLSADTVQEDGRPVHRIRILTNEGRVRRLRVDGRTGRPFRRRRR